MAMHTEDHRGLDVIENPETGDFEIRCHECGMLYAICDQRPSPGESYNLVERLQNPPFIRYAEGA